MVGRGGWEGWLGGVVGRGDWEGWLGEGGGWEGWLGGGMLLNDECLFRCTMKIGTAFDVEGTPLW